MANVIATSVILPLVPGESAGDRLVRIFRAHVGCSLSHRRDELARLVARGVDDPATVVGIRTNCATSALGVMALAGVKHPIVSRRYVGGMAVAWVRKVGLDLNALRRFDPKGMPLKKGSLLRYKTADKNNDHVEWLLEDVGHDMHALHGGGGRADNALTEMRGLVNWNYGRPLVEWWDPDMLGIDVLAEVPCA